MKHHTLVSMFLTTAVSCLMASADAGNPDRFFVTVTGAGPDVVMIPGLASSGKVWDATVKQLAAGHRVHVIQIAGFAGAPAGPNAADGKMLAPLIAEMSRYVSTLKSPSIAGHSLGGLIALEIAAGLPEEVSRVLVVDALPFYPLLFNPEATVQRVKPQASAMLEQMLAQTDAAHESALRSNAARLSRSETGRVKVAAWSVASDRRVVAKAMHEIMTWDARPVLPRVRAKITVVYAWDAAMGMAPALLDQRYTTAYAGLAGVEMKRIDESFHFIMLDQPDAFARVVDKSL